DPHHALPQAAGNAIGTSQPRAAKGSGRREGAHDRQNPRADPQEEPSMSLRSAEAIHGSILAPSQNWIIPHSQLEVHRNGHSQPERSISLPTVPRRRTICGIEVPRELCPIADAIERSRGMLDLEDDWDGEGSPAYQQEDWERAVRMLLRACVDY